MSEELRDGRTVVRRQAIALDGAHFDNVHFDQCVLTYCGLLGITFNNCRFENCEFVFDGPAQRALEWLKTMAGMGDFGQDLIRRFFESILKGRITTYDEGEKTFYSMEGPKTLQ